MKLKKTMIQGQVCYIPCDEEETEDVIVVDETLTVRATNQEDHPQANKDETKQAKRTGSQGFLSGWGWVRGKEQDTVPARKVYEMLPFMDDEELSWLTDQILAGKEDYASLDLVALMPFLSDADCDAVFMKAMEQQQPLNDLLPFVSDSCRHELVQRYMSGEEIRCDINCLYPFLSNADLKELFYYTCNKEIQSN